MHMVIYGSPYSLSKNLGQAYNEFLGLLPNASDFACLTDADAMFTVPNYGHLIDAVIHRYPECRLFYAKTQRIACRWQLDKTIRSDHMPRHRAHGKALAEKYGASCIPAGDSPPGSGFLILVRKDLWQQVPFREQGILGVDWDFYRRVQALNEPILLMQGIYLYHWYRGGKKRSTQHLQ